MKKVAATSGQSVRRTDFLLGKTATGCCGYSVGALAVANFDGFLLERLTLSYSIAGWFVFELPSS
jgi:hypothetical protein